METLQKESFEEGRHRFSFGRECAGALLAVAFLAPWVPCFLRRGLMGDGLLALEPFGAFSTAVPAGCLLAAAALLLVRTLRPDVVPYHRARVLFVGAYVGGYGLFSLAFLLGWHSTASSVAGVVAGAGAVPVGAMWCSRVGAPGFSGLLARGAVVGLLVFAVMGALAALPAEGCAVGWFVLSALSGFLLLARGAGDAAEPSSTVDASLREGVSQLLSTRSAFSVIATAAVGLAPFVLLSNILPGVTVGEFTFNSSTGLLIGSLLTLAMAWFARANRSIAPTLFWTVFPVCAGILVVLVSFPKESFASTLSAGLAFAFFSMLGVFAVVCVIQVVAQREFPPALVVAPPFILAALAALAADALGGAAVSVDEAGAVLLVITTAYFVFLMLSPVFQLRHLLRDGAPSEEAASPSSAMAFDEACDVLADARGLSKREREVFGYLVRGYTSPYIAKALFISDSTVRSHTKSIYRKFDADSRTNLIEIVRHFAEEGAVPA